MRGPSPQPRHHPVTRHLSAPPGFVTRLLSAPPLSHCPACASLAVVLAVLPTLTPLKPHPLLSPDPPMPLPHHDRDGSREWGVVVGGSVTKPSRDEDCPATLASILGTHANRSPPVVEPKARIRPR